MNLMNVYIKDCFFLNIVDINAGSIADTDHPSGV
jgi:hypothetical protein